MNNLTSIQNKHFDVYKNLLIEWNNKFNLTRITDPEEIKRKHFANSLSYAEAITFAGFDLTKPLEVCDVGSGAGFPGLPLKIVYPHWNVTLVEATTKKCLFLEEVIKELDLKGITVLNRRAESVASTYEVVLTRAVAPLDKLITWCLPLLKPNGALITQKGLQELPTIKEFSRRYPKLRIEFLEHGEKVFVIIKGRTS